MNILILGGTAEARELADRLQDLGHVVTTALAGRTQAPKLPRGGVRIGGFGGVAGLAAFMRAAGTDKLIDATHPFAGQISSNAVAAAQISSVPLLRLMRQPWQQPQGADWLTVETAAEAAAALPPGSTVLLTTGHTGLAAFLDRDDCSFLVRLIEPPEISMQAHAKLLLTRPPFTLLDEMDLMKRSRITHLVSKNSGGTQTAAKLEAAQRLGVKVIMIARPAYGPAREVETVAEALAALASP